MSRKLREGEYDDRPVEACAVAPHRYTWEGQDNPYQHAKRVTDFLRGVAYQKGDVVYVERNGAPVKALILYVGCSRDSWGDRREWFKVLLATRKGKWSGAWHRTYPGFVQRGYQLAGLAPDVPATR